MKKKLTLLALSFAFVFGGGFAFGEDEHPLSTIQGTQIELKYSDHAFAGSINGIVAFGYLDEDTFSSELVLRKHGSLIKTIFSKDPATKIFGGQLLSVDTNGSQRRTLLTVTAIQPKEQKISLKINEEQIEMLVSADRFENGHFINPTYSTVYQGQTISYKVEGSACYGVSSHFALMILAAYVH